MAGGAAGTCVPQRPAISNVLIILGANRHITPEHSLKLIPVYLTSREARPDLAVPGILACGDIGEILDEFHSYPFIIDRGHTNTIRTSANLYRNTW